MGVLISGSDRDFVYVIPFDERTTCREPGEGGADELDEEENAPLSAASLMTGEEHAMAGTAAAGGGGSASVAASEEVLPEVRLRRAMVVWISLRERWLGGFESVSSKTLNRFRAKLLTQVLLFIFGS